MAANLTTKFRIKIELIFWNVDIKVIKNCWQLIPVYSVRLYGLVKEGF